LETSFSFPKATLIVGNLPYYITSPILRKFFEGNSQLEHQIIGGLFMVQEEVGEKIRYDAKKKSYLYWLLNYAYQVEYLKSIPAKAFSPAPKVKSCIISLVKKPILPQLSFEQLQAFLDAFSPYSRKTLGKIAKMLKKKGITYNLPEQFVSKRLEELHWEDVEFILQA
jgi:16S rRNA (adenine1518-N6/adenine1519-N6)-dimethyltransferase